MNSEQPKNGDTKVFKNWKLYFWDGEWKSSTDWAKHRGIPAGTFKGWIYHHGFISSMQREHIARGECVVGKKLLAVIPRRKKRGKKNQISKSYGIVKRGLDTEKIKCSITGAKAGESLCRGCQEPVSCFIREALQKLPPAQ